MFKVIAIGDPHFRTKYIQVIEKFAEQTLEHIERVKPDLVVVLGDTLHHHEKTDSECHTRAVKWFMAISKLTKLVVLIGNHDRRNNSDFQSDVHFFTGLQNETNIWVVDKTVRLEFDISQSTSDEKLEFVFVPYVAPGRFKEALDSLEVKIEYRWPLAIFAHQEFKGAKMGAIVSVHGDEWPVENPFIISGHIHECQMPQSNILYCGTPYQTTYSESTGKGLYLFNYGREHVNAWKKYSGDNDVQRTPVVPYADLLPLKLRVKTSITMSPSEFLTTEIPSWENLDLRIIIIGQSCDIEHLKKSPKYKELANENSEKNAGLKIVLRPIFEFQPDPKFHKKKYRDALLETIGNDKDLLAIYNFAFSN